MTSDYFEVDFLSVEAKDSGDAITLRYSIDGNIRIHVVDGGYQATGDHVINHIRTCYDKTLKVDAVVATHPDGDHLGGLRAVLEECSVGELWMLRPWSYAGELIGRFENIYSIDYLVRHLKEAYPNVAALEEIALRRGITIREPLQGAEIGAFRVLAPSKTRYLDLVVSSDKTSASVDETQKSAFSELTAIMAKAARAAVTLIKAAWGAENFSSEDVSAENKMSVMQYAYISGKRILLTADAGIESFAEAASYAPSIGLNLPGIDCFQAPHHGSRRNVSTALLDQWLGPRLPSQLPAGQEKFIAVISSSKEDPDHPRKSVLRGCIHRGGIVAATEGRDVVMKHNAPFRQDWGPIGGDAYPAEQEE